MGMICCEFCHSEIPDHARFCPRCGRAIKQTAATIETDTDTDFLPILGEDAWLPHGNVPMVQGTPQVGGVPSVQGTPQDSFAKDALPRYGQQSPHQQPPHQQASHLQPQHQPPAHLQPQHQLPAHQQPLHLHPQVSHQHAASAPAHQTPAGTPALLRSYVTPRKRFRQGNPILDILQKIRSMISIDNGDVSRQIKTLSLFAIARATLEEDDRAFIGKTYTVQAGVSQSKPSDFAGEPFDPPIRNIDKPMPFDVSFHASENIELTTEWHKRLLYDPRNPEPQLVEFTFQMMRLGKSYLVLDFYHQRHWLSTIRFDFESVEQSQRTTVSSEV